MFNFEKLDVCQEAIVFADLVCDVTATFPNDERFGLTSQMRCAAISTGESSNSLRAIEVNRPYLSREEHEGRG